MAAIVAPTKVYRLSVKTCWAMYIAIVQSLGSCSEFGDLVKEIDIMSRPVDSQSPNSEVQPACFSVMKVSVHDEATSTVAALHASFSRWFSIAQS